MVFNMDSKEIYQSAKVYVFDFHFEHGSKQAINKKKEELDKFFDRLRTELEQKHKGTAIQQIFLRKH